MCVWGGNTACLLAGGGDLCLTSLCSTSKVRWEGSSGPLRYM